MTSTTCDKLVSIIIPVYNRAKYLEATLDSILQQSYENWECILVDDHSIDESLEICKKYAEIDPRFRWAVRPNHRQKGANACRNYGYELSSGAYIQWFDSDDIMPEDALTHKITLIEKSNVDFVVGKVVFFKVQKQYVDTPYLLKSDSPLADYIANKLLFYTHGPLFTRNFLEAQSYLFDEQLQMRQDGEFYFRILLQKPNYIATEHQAALIRVHENNMTTNHQNKKALDRTKINIDYYFKCVENYHTMYSERDQNFEQTSIAIIRSQANHSKSLRLLTQVYNRFFQIDFVKQYPSLFLYYWRDVLRVLRHSVMGIPSNQR